MRHSMEENSTLLDSMDPDENPYLAPRRCHHGGESDPFASFGHTIQLGLPYVYAFSPSARILPVAAELRRPPFGDVVGQGDADRGRIGGKGVGAGVPR